MNIDKPTCMICGCDSGFYFSKTYDAKYTAPRPPLHVDYYKCENCGFVFSRTHQTMPKQEWEQLNYEWHANWDSVELDLDSALTNRPPFLEQALVLSILAKHGLVDIGNTLDFAAGYGLLAQLTEKYFGHKISVFEKYVHEGNVRYLKEEELGKYPLVLNTAMFEHVISRDILEDINGLVDETGVLMIHTVVCERVPADSDWFYLVPPVHTAFHTNKSMGILMDQWGYTESLYSPQAKCWFLFKNRSPVLPILEKKCEEINIELQAKWLYHKKGFVDYWKEF